MRSKHARSSVGRQEDVDLTAEQLKELAGEYKEIVQKHKGFDFPQDPLEQLRLATEAVFRSWNGKRAIDYRNATKASRTTWAPPSTS